jgi:V/A-type H+-transporting ATPase subunit I
MIRKMKKVLLFTPDIAEDVEANLTLLGQLGVMHITPFQPAKDHTIDRVDARIKQLQTALAALDSVGEHQTVSAVPSSPEESETGDDQRKEITLMERTLNADNKRIELEQKLEELNEAKAWYERWGNVNFTDIEELRRSGVTIRLFLLNKRQKKEALRNKDAHLLGVEKDKYQVMLVTEDEEALLPFDEVSFPNYPFNELEAEMENTRIQLRQILQVLLNIRSRADLLEEALEERYRRYNVRNVQFGGMVIEEMVRCWRGFIPEKAVDQFIKVADENNWGYMISDPTTEEADEVPTLIESPRWAERIQPVMNFMGLVPGYRELDVSKIFMLFFTFFTGILVGDAGYGLVFLLITILVHSRKRFKRKVEFELFYALSASILVWGVLTGTYFGSAAIAEIRFLSILKIDILASFGGDRIAIQKLMFLIGAIHLSIGRIQLAFKYINRLRAISQLGWIAIIWGLNMVVNYMVLGIPTPDFMIWLFIGGSILVALFSNSGTKFFKGVISSLANLPLSIINGFSDIISYIRLYAVGLATVLMATSFNEMAIGDGITTIASGISAVLILIMGHALNMILAGMAVIVHGVRLNMLEYAGHADIEFSGTDYNPFKIRNNKQS